MLRTSYRLLGTVVLVTSGLLAGFAHAQVALPKAAVRPEQTTTLLSSGSVLLIGGRGLDSRPVADAYLVDDHGRSQHLASTLLHPRSGHTATVLPDGTVAIIGGTGPDNKVVPQVEIFDPAKQVFRELAGSLITPRSHHTATVLPGGLLLIAGGVTGGSAFPDDVQLWDYRTGKVASSAAALRLPRENHQATLLSNGKVLISGGTDVYGASLHRDELFDPETRTSVELPSDESLTTNNATAQLALSSPEDGSSAFPIDGIPWLLFSRSVDVRSLLTTHLRLTNSAGKLIDARIVGVEGGKLAFIQPSTALQPATQYTLKLTGVLDTQGRALPVITLQFQTGGIPSDATEPEWIPSARNLAGDWNSGTGASRWQELPALKAANGVTALSGQVLTLSGYPLARVTLNYEGKSVTSESTGRFLLSALAPGRHVFTIDGRSANQPGAAYGLYEVGVTVKAGITNVLNYTIWMSKLDISHAVTVSFPTTKETVITTPRIPGLELHLPAGTTIVDHDGKPATSISITAIPLDKPPFPLPAGVRIPTYFTIQPGGASIEVKNLSRRNNGAWLVYPNAYKLNAGSVFDFWNYDADARGWYVYGQGKVDKSGTQVQPNPGVYLYEFTGAMVGSPSGAPSTGPNAGGGPNGNGGDPVDLSSGLFVYNHTDLAIPDTMPLSVSRTYRPNDSMSRSFGVGQTDNYDIFMVGNTFPYTYQELILADGSRIRFNRTSPGTSYGDAVYEHTATRSEWYGATLALTPNVFPNGYWVVTKKDGTQYNFPEAAGQTIPGLQAATYIRDRNGNLLTITRDSGGNLSRVSSPNGNSLTYTIDAQKRITAITDNIGRTLSYAYTAQGDLSTYTDALGGVTTYTYDDQHNMLTITDPMGQTYLTNTYDANGRVLTQTMSDGGTYQFSWTLSSNTAQTWVMQSTSPDAGFVNRYSTTDSEGYTGLIASVQVTDPRGYIRKVVFNPLGYISSDTYALGQATQQVTSTIYYADNLPKTITDPLGRKTTLDYDANGNLTTYTRLAGTTSAVTTSLTYTSAYNQLATLTDPLGHIANYSYDSVGNMTIATDPLGSQTVLTYDGTGNPATVTDPVNQTAKFSYLGGYLASVRDPLGNITTDFTDYAGRVLSATDPQGNTTKYQYDALNRITQSTDPLQHSTKYTYNKNGDLLSTTDPLSHTISAGYDSLDRQTSFSDGLSRTAQSTYDKGGNLVSTTDRKGLLTVFSYDPLNRVTLAGFGTQTVSGKTTYQSSIAYTYDAGNRLTKAVDSAGGTITRTYDLLDRLTKEVTAQGSIAYTYDNAGRLTSSTVTGQTAITYTYDADNRLTGITQGTKSVAFTLDAAGRRTGMTLPNGITAAYTYDGGSRLTQIVYTLGAKTLGNLTYTYNALNQRTSTGGTLANLSLPAVLTSATYDAANQLTKWGSATVTHDADGNTLNDGLNTYTWNARGQLSAVSGGEVDSFVYDAFGRRVSRTKAGTKTSYLYAGVNAVQKLQGTTVTTNLITGGVDEFFDYAQASSDLVPLVDGQGSVVALADSTGYLSTQYQYDPFGNTTPLGALSDNAQQYTGRENDGSLYYYRARYYNAAVGRFISEDPEGYAGSGPSFYTYAGEDPMDFNDPFGMDKNPNNEPPWYDSCTAKALGEGALSIGIDALGFIPGEKDLEAAIEIGAGTTARQIGNWKGYRGIVADQYGKKFIISRSKDVTDVATGYGIGNGLGTNDWLGAGLSAAGLIPGLNEFAAAASVIYDGVKTAKAVIGCF